MAELLPIGKIGKIFGAKGELSLVLYDSMPEDFNLEEPVFVDVESLTVPLFFDKFEPRGRSGATARFADIDTERRAAELVGREFCIMVENDRQEDEFYMEDLVGFRAEVGDQIEGQITDYIDSPLNPLFEIEVDGREVLIPAVDEFVTEIDIEQRVVTFSLPEGMLSLND
ncbi:MAG: 16S rRNA processing protein RimM [Rikenellaceae bacterium]|nr:16S rRNA processing protein RimM [Rikenellaceae bacterium]